MGFLDIDPVHALVGGDSVESCVWCHGGVSPVEIELGITNAMEEGHAYDTEKAIIRDASLSSEEKCMICHSDISNRNRFSTHSMLWGERYKVALRSYGVESLDNCPVEVVDEFNNECMSCHTTCGQCHVSRPNSVGGGFLYRHQFKKTPEMRNNCTACHGSRIGVDFFGYNEGEGLSGNARDIHYGKGMNCLSCHGHQSGFEDFHGSGNEEMNPPKTRYAVEGLATCEVCHSELSSSNLYHIVHWPDNSSSSDLSCFVCHSQPYNNCNSCHTEGEWKNGYTEVENDIFVGGGNYKEYPEFRIAFNPAYENPDGNWSPSLKAHSNNKWILVRHIPVVSDTYAPWDIGIDDIDLTVSETWEYTSPHNILRWTAQTDTSGMGGICSAKCHTDGIDNVDLYLWKTFVDTSTNDLNANLHIVVDDHLSTGNK